MKPIVFRAFLIASVIITNAYAQPALQWQKVYGGSFSDYRTYSIDTTTDGGSIIAGGYAYAYNAADVGGFNDSTEGFLIRFDALHNIVWQKTYATASGGSSFNSVKHTSDGGFIACGTASPVSNEIFVVKTNSNGDTLWQRSLPYFSSAAGTSVIEASDGNYVVAGFGTGGPATALIIKFNTNGDTLWSKFYGASPYAFLRSVKQTPDGGYIAAGNYEASGTDTTSFGGSDVYLVKTDASGNEQWEKKYGGSNSDIAFSVDVTTDGGYILGGNTQSTDGEVTNNHGGLDYWVVKTDGAGTLQWQKTYGGSQNETIFSISQTTDGNYIAAGGSSSSDGDVIGHHSGSVIHSDAWILNLGDTGKIIWQNSIGSVYDEAARGIIQKAAGYIFTGINNSKDYSSSGAYFTVANDYWLVNLNASGDTTSQLINGASGGYNAATSILQTADNGYIAAGYGNSNNHDVVGNHGGTDGWIVKTDNAGAIQWSKSLGGSDNDYILSINKTSDGGYIAAGASNSSDGDVTVNKGRSDFWIVKLSSTGALQWQKTYGGSGFDSATSVQQTMDGGYIVAGKTSSTDGDVTGIHSLYYDAWVIKLDASGNLVWQKTLGGSATDILNSIKQTSDGGYIAAGISNSTDGDVTGNHGGNDCWIVKLNASGTLVWEKSLGGSGDDFDQSILQTTDGGYIAAGATTSSNGDVTANHGGYDFWITKLDASGNLSWQKTYGGSSNDQAASIIQTNDGDYVIAGNSSSADSMVTNNHGGYDYWIIKIDDTGNLVWEKSLGGSLFDVAYGVQQTTDNGYIVAGYTSSYDGNVTNNFGVYNYWLVKLTDGVLPVTLTNFTGVIENNTAVLSWSTASESNNKGFEIQRSNNGINFYDIAFVPGAGTSSIHHSYTYTDNGLISGGNYYRLVQKDIDGKLTYSGIIRLNYSTFVWNILGNPSTVNSAVQLQLSDEENVSIKIISASGAIVKSINKQTMDEGTYLIPLNLGNLPKGVYTVQLIAGSQVYARQIVR